MTLALRLEKLGFLAKEMQLAQRLAQFAPTDADARMLARHVLIRAKDFIEHARQLRKPLNAAGFDTRKFHELKEYVAQEFDAYFQKVRDKLGAHVQDLEFLERIEQWNSVDSSKSEFFVDAAAEIYRLLEGLSVPGYLPLTEFPELSDPDFDQTLVDYRGSGSKVVSVEMGSDSLSMTRPNSTSMLNMHPIHARGGQLALLHRWIEAQKKLLVRFAAYPNVIRILKSRIITDVISACDCLVTRPIALGAPQAMDGLDTLLTASDGPQHPIEKFKAVFDLDKVAEPLRTVRNKIGGHLDEDPTVPLPALLKMLDETPVGDAFKLYDTLRGVFQQTAVELRYLATFLADGSTLYGVSGTQKGDSVTPFDDKPTPGRAVPIHERYPESDEELAAKLEDWLTGDEATKGRARSAFYQAFMSTPVVEMVQTEDRIGGATHHHQHELRSAHQFLLRALQEEKDPNRVIGMLELARANSSGYPQPLTDILLRFATSPQGAPYLSPIATCIGDLAVWRNERARQFLNAGMPSPLTLGIQSRMSLFRMFVRSEGLILTNRGQAVDTLPNVMALLTKGYDARGLLLTNIYLASQFCDQRISAFAKPFEADHAAIRADIVRLAGGLVGDSESKRVRDVVQQLANAWDYPGICAFLFDELKGSNHEPIGKMLVEYVCAGAILVANHDQSRRHLCACQLRHEQYEEALEWAERIASANPVNVDLQVLHAQALACVAARREEAVRRVAEIDRLYRLDASQRRIIDGLKADLAAADDEVAT
jgi:hypothetical protein